MPNKRRTKVIFRVVTVLAAVAIVSAAIWIILRRQGLVDSYDFGAGAYYYADDPQLQDLAESSAESYSTAVPRWVHILLFFAWGWLMWRLWVWVDGRINKKNHGTDKQD